MGVTAESVIVALEARVGRYNSEINAAAANTERKMRAIGDAAERTSGRTSAAFGRLRAAALTLASLGAARAFVDLADQSSRMTSKLQLAADGLGDFRQAQKDVNSIAGETRSAIGGVADLYGSIARSSKDLKANQEDVARATLTVAEALKVSGASTAEADSVTRQLSQALASGTLRGDEFNSIMENGPRLAKLLADSLGVTTGALRSMAENGELTSDKLFKALNDRNFTAGLDAEFKRVAPTFDDAATAVKNIAISVFGGFDRGGRFSQSIASFATEGSGNIEKIGDTAEQVGKDIRASFETLDDVFEPLVSGANKAFDAIGIDAGLTADNIRAVLNRAAQIANPVTAVFGLAQTAKDYQQYRNGQPRDLTGVNRPYATSDRGFAAPLSNNLKQPSGPLGKKAISPAGIFPGLALALSNLPIEEIVAGMKQAADAADGIGAATERAETAQKGMTAGAKEMVAALIEDNRLALLRAEGRDQEARDVEAIARIAQQVAVIDGLSTNQREALLVVMRDLTIEGMRQVEFAQKRLDIETQFQSDLATRAGDVSDAIMQGITDKANAALDDYEARGARTQAFLANTFEDLFNNGVGSVWDNFKRIGISVISEVLAQLVTTGRVSSGGGDFLSSVFSIGTSLFGGRASGGGVSAGQLYQVNERGVEGFRPAQSGTIIPLGQMPNAISPGAGQPAIAKVRLELSGDIDARIVSVSGQVAVETVRAAAPSIVDASANETFRRASRGKL